MSRVLGTILIFLGLIGILWGGFSYTRQKKVIDMGTIEATRVHTHRIPVPPVAGAVSMIAGIAFLAADKRS